MRALLLIVVTACPDPAARDDVLELATPLLEDIEAGTDVMLCTYLDYRAAEEVDLVEVHGFQTEFGHHALLFGVRSDQPAGTHPCTEADMVNVRYLAGHGGEGASTLPVSDGVAFRLRKGEQVMIQTHWINTGDGPTSGSASFRVTVAPPSPDRAPADLFTVVSTQLDIAPGEGTARAECVLPRDLSLVMLGGHAHERGRRVTITHRDEMLYDEPWSEHSVFDPELLQWDATAPLQLRAGDRIRVDCVYENETGAPLGFPAEMCALFGYWFPADREIDCVDGSWPP
jgi:hypothetical protein